MRRWMGFLGVLAFMLSLTACAGSPKSEGCCPMCATGCKAEEKAMKCEKKEKAGCCDKAAADGKKAEGHQH